MFYRQVGGSRAGVEVAVHDHAALRDAPPRAAAGARLARRGRARHAHADHLLPLQRHTPTRTRRYIFFKQVS